MTDAVQYLAHISPPPPIATGPFTTRQQEILNGLEAIILEEGFRHLTVGELAQRLNCSRRTLYELAPSKDELVLLVLDRLLRRMGSHAHAQLRKYNDPIQRVESFMGAAISEIRALSLSFAEDVERHAAARRLMTAHYEFATDVLGGVIQDGIDQGVFRPVHARLVAQLLDAAVARLQEPRALRMVGLPESETMEELTSIILHGIIAAGDAHASPRE